METKAKELLTKLASRVISYLRDEVGLKNVNNNFSIQSADYIQHLFVSSIIFLHKDMSGTIGMSMNKDLIAPIVESMMFCKITEAEINEYAADTVAETLNITLANVIQELDIVKNGGDVTISAPLILDQEAVIQKAKIGKILFVELSIENNKVTIEITPLKNPLEPLELDVPTDPSSAFFFAVAAAITKSRVVLKNLTLNPTRIEAYKVLEQMGAKITYIQKENIYEPIGDIIVEYCELNGVTVDKNIAWLIDELPALSIAMSMANGKSLVKNAQELRVKESDRIKSVIENLKLCGVECIEYKDGYLIEGRATLKKAIINSKGDHRIAMSFAIAGLLCDMDIEDTACIDTSFPNFMEILNKLTK